MLRIFVPLCFPSKSKSLILINKIYISYLLFLHGEVSSTKSGNQLTKHEPANTAKELEISLNKIPFPCFLLLHLNSPFSLDSIIKKIFHD